MKVKIVLCFLLSLSFAQAQSNLPVVVSNLVATNFNSQEFNQTTNNPTQTTESTKCNQASHRITDEIVSGTMSGIATAFLWAIFVWIWQIRKASKIRRQIRKSFIGQKIAIYDPGPPDSFGINIENKSPWPVIIRDAGFSCGRSVFHCGYLGKKERVYDKHILLKTKTGDRWGLSIEKLQKPIQAVWIEYEFDTVFGQSEVEKIELGDDVTKFYEEQRLQTRANLGFET